MAREARAPILAEVGVRRGTLLRRRGRTAARELALAANMVTVRVLVRWKEDKQDAVVEAPAPPASKKSPLPNSQSSSPPTPSLRRARELQTSRFPPLAPPHRRRRSMRTSALLAPDPGNPQRVRGGGGLGVPTLVYCLIAFAIALPTLSFFAMHARMLDRQEVLSRNFAVRRVCVRLRMRLCACA
jgi:hypothetical protein